MMKTEEAIRLIRNLPTMCEFTDAYGEPIDSDAYYEAVDMAISALRAQDLQPTCNNLATDCIRRSDAIDAFGLSEKTRKYGGDHSGYDTMMLYEIQDTLESLPSAQPESNCLGCKHAGMWEDEVEYGYPSPCTGCKRRANDNYEQ